MDKKETIAKKEVLFIFILAVFIFLFRTQASNMPFDRDEGAYAYIAERLSFNELPYKAVFDHKPPMIYYIYKTAFEIFKEKTVGAVRNFTTLYVILTAVLLYIFARVVSRSAYLAMLAALFYAVYQENYTFQGLGANTEVFTQFPLIAASLFLLDREKKYEHVGFFISGFFIAAGFYIKTMTGFFAAVPLLYILFYVREARLKGALWFLLGFAILHAAVFNWAIFKGILPDFYECVFRYNFMYMNLKNDPASTGLMFRGLKAFAAAFTLPCLAFFYSGYRLFREKKDGVNFTLFSAVAALLSGVLLLKGTYPHYFIGLLPFLSVLGAMMVKDLYVFLSSKKALKNYAATLVALLLLLNFAAYAAASRAGAFLSNGKLAMDIFYEARAMAGVINSDKPAGATLFAWPDEPEIYFYTSTKALTRFIYSYPLDVYRDESARVRKTFTDTRPDFVVFQKGMYDMYTGFVNDYYRKVMETGNLVLYRRLF